MLRLHAWKYFKWSVNWLIAKVAWLNFKWSVNWLMAKVAWLYFRWSGDWTRLFHEKVLLPGVWDAQLWRGDWKVLLLHSGKKHLWIGEQVRYQGNIKKITISEIQKLRIESFLNPDCEWKLLYCTGIYDLRALLLFRKFLLIYEDFFSFTVWRILKRNKST